MPSAVLDFVSYYYKIPFNFIFYQLNAEIFIIIQFVQKPSMLIILNAFLSVSRLKYVKYVAQFMMYRLFVND